MEMKKKRRKGRDDGVSGCAREEVGVGGVGRIFIKLGLVSL